MRILLRQVDLFCLLSDATAFMNFTQPLHPLRTTPLTRSLSSRTNVWLKNTGSLSNQIRAACTNFCVDLLEKEVRGIWPLATLPHQYFKKNESIIKRSVLLKADKQPWVYAESYFPEHVFTLYFSDLNNSTLGDILFNTPHCVRFQMNIFNYTACLKNHPVLHNIQSHFIVGRRSWFHFYQYPLMIDEVFLPQHPLYQQ